MAAKATLESAISNYGSQIRAKLSNLVVTGEPEDQLRGPLETLIKDIADLVGIPRGTVTVVGETSRVDLKTRPDFAVTRNQKLLIGFIEVKAPGKGADPRQFKNPHDREQWLKLQSLPNLLYTDGQEFSLWHEGDLVALVPLEGDISSPKGKLQAPVALLKLFDDFFQWQPTPPKTARQLAEQSARLCRFLRDEVTEHLALGSKALNALAKGWRKMLFPDATDEIFADGYAQAVTFGLLIARARNISLSDGLDRAARELGGTDSLIAEALRIITFNVEHDQTLKTSLATLSRVLDVVSWEEIKHGDRETWLYFYEDFLEVYDNAKKKETGSYYTPAEVVSAMVRLVDEALRSRERFNLKRGLADTDNVKIADPAVGTGTFMLGIFRHIAEYVAEAEGEGAVQAAIDAALSRVVAFEMQLGPFAVAQLRILAEVTQLIGGLPRQPVRMYVTDTLANPYIEEETLPGFDKIAESRQKANQIKKAEPITVVIGNPPYKEKAKGMGGWVEAQKLKDWMPPKDWKLGTHAKHLRNLYIYFWRWATWKVFDHHAADDTGIVCFITVAGFLNGPGFQAMRQYLRQRANEIWVVDCSPEGHQPDVPTRIFQGVQQPVCIVVASRQRPDDQSPATVRFRALPEGSREGKFAALAKIALDDQGWEECAAGWRAPFLPAAVGAWSEYPAIDDFFVYDGSGVMPGRVWVIAPDAESLKRRWNDLINAPKDQQEGLFQPHMRGGEPGDKHLNKTLKAGLHGHESRTIAVGKDHGPCIKPIRYAFRSFDRQWIIPDGRLINQANPQLWDWYSPQQIHLTAPHDRSATAGPALTFTALIPDLHHYHGRGGRVFPLWQGGDERQSNIRPALLQLLCKKYRADLTAEDVMAYLAAIAAHPAYTARFQEDLEQPGLRIPLTSKAALFREAIEFGRRVIWLHTYGERFVDASADRPSGPPRLSKDKAPRVPAAGRIPDAPEEMPDEIAYDQGLQRLLIGSGYVERVTPEMWHYEVSGKQVVRQWFSYRQKDRSRPIMGDRREPSKLGEIQPDHWIAEYTTDLIDLLNILGLLIELEPKQEKLLERICRGPLHKVSDLAAAGALVLPPQGKSQKVLKGQRSLLSGLD